MSRLNKKSAGRRVRRFLAAIFGGVLMLLLRVPFVFPLSIAAWVTVPVFALWGLTGFAKACDGGICAGSRKWWLRTVLYLTGMALSVIVARIVVRVVCGPGGYPW